MKRILILSIFLLFVSSFLLKVDFVNAGSLSKEIMEQVNAGVTSAKFGQPADPQLVIANIISLVLGFTGMVFMALIVYGGYSYITASGDEEKAKKAMSTVKSAIIGLVITLSAYSITMFVASKIRQAIVYEIPIEK